VPWRRFHGCVKAARLQDDTYQSTPIGVQRHVKPCFPCILSLASLPRLFAGRQAGRRAGFDVSFLKTRLASQCFSQLCSRESFPSGGTASYIHYRPLGSLDDAGSPIIISAQSIIIQEKVLSLDTSTNKDDDLISTRDNIIAQLPSWETRFSVK
jgi:hypothetical protein